MIRVHIDIADLQELFQAPAYDPFAGKFEQEAGIERALEQLEGQRPDGQGVFEIALASPTTVPVSEVRDAIAAFCREGRIDTERMARLTRKRGIQALWIGLPVLAICLALSSLTAAWTDHAAGGLLSNSFIIAGWVAMWRPAELLLYDWWPLGHRARLLERLAALEVKLITP